MLLLHIDKAQLRTNIANGTKVIGPYKNKLINENGKGLPQVIVTFATNHAGFEHHFGQQSSSDVHVSDHVSGHRWASAISHKPGTMKSLRSSAGHPLVTEPKRKPLELECQL